MNKEDRIRELVEILNQASAAYYGAKEEVMSNAEWDALFDELTLLEEETGMVLSDSPTQTVGTEEENIPDGQREAHEYPALSLAKSKDVGVLMRWAGSRPIWLSWKLDGLTLVATYDSGKLTKLMTRGGGVYGTNITYLADYIAGLPKAVSEQGHMVVRGEAVISYSDFNELNEKMENEDDRYANPRNLVSGTMSLDHTRASEVKDRKVCFHAFTLVHLDRPMVSWGERMDYLQDMGFTVVDREATDSEGLAAVIERWTLRVTSGEMDFPVDGLVITYDDTDFAATGSVTGHHATNAGMAFKWQDTEAETTLDHVEWSCAAFAISPVAIFDPVQLEGTEVKRASLCNISEMRRLGIGEDRKTSLTVIKSNMIIPKCIRADGHGTSFTIPEFCPVCGAKTEIRTSEKTGTETLHCSNPDCTAKHLQKYTRFVSKLGMDIDGLSEKTLMRFINEGFITDFADIYRIAEHKDAILTMDGFGAKSYENLIASVEKSRKKNPIPFIYALCIPMIGQDAAKKMFEAYGTAGFFEHLEQGLGFEEVDGIGPEKSNSIMAWYGDVKNRALLAKLRGEISLEELAPVEKGGRKYEDMTFVVTGDVHIFKNRNELKKYIEEGGGKVAGSVSKKTTYLINNDVTSQSSKNKKARELGIPILSEEDFMSL